MQIQCRACLAHDILNAFVCERVLSGQLVITDAINQIGQDDFPVPGAMDVIADHDGYALVAVVVSPCFFHVTHGGGAVVFQCTPNKWLCVKRALGQPYTHGDECQESGDHPLQNGR